MLTVLNESDTVDMASSSTSTASSSRFKQPTLPRLCLDRDWVQSFGGGIRRFASFSWWDCLVFLWPAEIGMDACDHVWQILNSMQISIGITETSHQYLKYVFLHTQHTVLGGSSSCCSCCCCSSIMELAALFVALTSRPCLSDCEDFASAFKSPTSYNSPVIFIFF